MLRKVLGLALVVGLAWTGFVVAQEADKECTGVCSVTEEMGKLPRMAYNVGEESACCRMSAERLAEKSGAELQFIVLNKSYEDEVEAMAALADETETFVDNFANPSTCQVSGTTTVAGQSLHCSEKAAQVAKVVKEAMDGVRMSYKVGDEECHCPTQASNLAKESGEKQLFVVGDEATGCSIDARIKLAHAKYRAALQALVAMNEEPTTPVSTES